MLNLYKAHNRRTVDSMYVIGSSLRKFLRSVAESYHAIFAFAADLAQIIFARCRSSFTSCIYFCNLWKLTPKPLNQFHVYSLVNKRLHLSLGQQVNRKNGTNVFMLECQNGFILTLNTILLSRSLTKLVITTRCAGYGVSRPVSSWA